MKALLVLCLGGGIAAAQPAPDAKTLPLDVHRVETLFAEGTRHYDLGEYDQAIASFRQGYALLPDPSFLFNIGQSFRQQRRCRDATAAYKAYLRHAPDEDRAKVEAFLTELAPCAKAEEDQLARTLPPPALTPFHRKLRLAGVVVAGAGALAIGGGVYLGVRASNAATDLERTCGGTQRTCDAPTALAIERRGQDAQRDATRLYVAGGIVAGAGLGMLLYSFVRPEHEVLVLPTAGGAVFSIGGAL